MPPRKRKRSGASAAPAIPFVDGFWRRDASDQVAALGAFPHPLLADTSSPAFSEDHHNNADDGTAIFNPRPSLFQPLADCESDADWLSHTLEEGQTFDEYLQFLTLRSGRFKPIANAKAKTIYLVPIGTSFEASHGRLLERLLQYTRAFFQRPAQLLPAIEILPSSSSSSRSSSGTGKKKGKAKGKAKEKARWRVRDGGRDSDITVRTHGKEGEKDFRRQLFVDDVLWRLSEYKESAAFHGDGDDAFCVMGITMEDLYSHQSDLFVAGMAAGGSKVAVFSFLRYHPHLSYSEELWHDYVSVVTAHPAAYSALFVSHARAVRASLTHLRSLTLALPLTLAHLDRTWRRSRLGRWPPRRRRRRRSRGRGRRKRRRRARLVVLLP